MAKAIGEKITHKSGDILTIVSKRPAGEGKFFGRYVFILRNEQGESFRALGKVVTYASNVIPER